MCYAVGCKECGKTSWAGCGKHVPAVYNTIADKANDLCLCKSWPGVDLPPDFAAKLPPQTSKTPAEGHLNEHDWQKTLEKLGIRKHYTIITKVGFTSNKDQ